MEKCHQTYFFNAFSKPLLRVLDRLTPLAALVARVWVSYVFLKSGILSLMNWQSTLTLFYV